MKLSYIVALFFLTISSVGFSQTTNDDDYVLPFDSLTTKDKLHINFEMGVGGGSSQRYGSYFQTFYQPTLSYELSPKFTINSGLRYVNSSVSNFLMHTDYSYQSFTGNIAQYSAFIGGAYQLNENLKVGGSIYYDFTSYQSGFTTPSSGFDNVGYSAFFDYKVGKGFHIQGEVRINDKLSPFGRYGSSLYNNNSFFRGR